MNPLYKLLSSLKLTVVLLAFSMLLVFFGTLDQIHLGIHKAQTIYFESFFTVWPFREAGYSLTELGLPLPGGFLIGILLILNLSCSHFRYFRKSWKKTGIALIHTGVALLIASGFLTSFLQKETQMWIDEGAESNYTTDPKDAELVIIETTDPKKDIVTSIPHEQMTRGTTLTHENLPFSINVLEYFSNSASGKPTKEDPGLIANEGIGAKMQFKIFEAPMTYRHDTINTPSSLIHITADKKDLGKWIVSPFFNDRFSTQTFNFQDKTYTISLRPRRKYLPYSIKLVDFKHDVYPGTTIPKNYSSKVEITHHEKKEVRPALIYMNHPLRYEGLTFFQASFGKNNTASMFQVVKNEGWLIPYIAVALVGIGMIVQFMMHLIKFLKKSK